MQFQLKSKLKAARAEMADYREEQIRIREDLALTLENLQREQKLRHGCWGKNCTMRTLPSFLCRSLIVDNFIPPVETEKVIGRAVYCEEEEDWKLKPYQAPSSRQVNITHHHHQSNND